MTKGIISIDSPQTGSFSYQLGGDMKASEMIAAIEIIKHNLIQGILMKRNIKSQFKVKGMSERFKDL